MALFRRISNRLRGARLRDLHPRLQAVTELRRREGVCPSSSFGKNRLADSNWLCFAESLRLNARSSFGENSSFGRLAWRLVNKRLPTNGRDELRDFRDDDVRPFELQPMAGARDADVRAGFALVDPALALGELGGRRIFSGKDDKRDSGRHFEVEGELRTGLKGFEIRRHGEEGSRLAPEGSERRPVFARQLAHFAHQPLHGAGAGAGTDEIDQFRQHAASAQHGTERQADDSQASEQRSTAREAGTDGDPDFIPGRAAGPILNGHRIKKNETGNLLRPVVCIGANQETSERMPYQDVGLRHGGRGKQGAQLGDHLLDRALSSGGVTPTKTGAVVTGDTGEGGNLRRNERPAGGATGDAGFEDDSGGSSTLLVDVKTAPTQRNETAGRREAAAVKVRFDALIGDARR